MFIERLRLLNYRNLVSFETRFQSRKNLIFGPNGTGKTSILEAIYLLGFGKSFLNVNREELVNVHADFFSAQADIRNQRNENCIRGEFAGKSLGLFLNEHAANMGEISEYLYPIVFSSHTFQIYVDYLPWLRRLMDRFIFGVRPLYLHYILRYNRALKQKNHLLKNRPQTVDISEIDSWNQILAETGCKLFEERMKFVSQLNGENDGRFGQALKIVYRPSLLSGGSLSEDSFFRDLKSLMPQELKRKRSLIGPQRDHYEILLHGRKLNLFSSGEKKKFFLMVYFSYIGLYEKEKKEYPILMIDDFDSALDRENLDFMVDHYPDMQVLATSVNPNDRFDHLIELKRRGNA